MEKYKEDLRTEMILQGLEYEALAEADRSWMSTVSAMQQISTDGKFVGGPGLELKLDCYYRYRDRLLPYLPSSRPETAEPADEDSERDKLVEEYKAMVSSGQI